MNLKTQVHMPKPTMITSLINPESPGDHNEGWFSPGMARQDPVPFPSTASTHVTLKPGVVSRHILRTTDAAGVHPCPSSVASRIAA